MSSGSVPRLPGTDDRLVSPLDAVVMWATAALLIVSAAVAMLSYAFADIGWMRAVSFTAVPFLALGVYGFFREHRYVPLLVFAVASAAVYFVDPVLTQAVLVLTVCTEGVAVFAESVQRLAFFRLCHRLEFLSIKKKPDMADRAVRFFMGIPEGYDTRNLVMDPHVLRNRFPWEDVTKIMMLALLVSVVVWLTLSVGSAYSSDPLSNVSVLLTFALYASAVSAPFLVLGSVNLGLRSGRKVFSVGSGMSDTVGKMLFFGVLALVVAMLAAGPDADRVLSVLISVAAVAAVSVLSSSAYCIRTEARLVRDIVGFWDSELPLGRFEEKRERRAEDRTVPGTPVRDCRSCYKDLKDQ